MIKLKPGELIKYHSAWEDEFYLGIVTKKASRGYWVLWSDGCHKKLHPSLLRYAKRL